MNNSPIATTKKYNKQRYKLKVNRGNKMENTKSYFINLKEGRKAAKEKQRKAKETDEIQIAGW